MNERPVNAVVIGSGYAGERIHVPLIRLSSQVRLAGVCSGDAAKRHRIEREIGCRAYARLDEVLADREVDVVVLATPNRLHAAQAIDAMQAGKHVLIDKPMCLSSQESDQLLESARKSGRALGVFHNRRWDGDYLTLRRLIDERALGELRWLEMSWQRASLPRTWKQDPSAGGGRLIDLGSHLIDQALITFPGPVTSVFCRMHHDYPQLQVESHAMVTLTFAGGQTAIIDTTSMTYSPKPRFRALFERGTFVKYGTDPQEAALAAGRLHEASEPPEAWGIICDDAGQRPVPTEPGRWLAFYDSLGLAITRWPDAELPVPAAQGARVIAILEAAARSARAGQSIPLNV